MATAPVCSSPNILRRDVPVPSWTEPPPWDKLRVQVGSEFGSRGLCSTSLYSFHVMPKRWGGQETEVSRVLPGDGGHR